MTTPTKRLYSEIEAQQYEAIHIIVEGNLQSLAHTLKALISKGPDFEVEGQAWTFDRLVDVLESEKYQAWSNRYRKLMLEHGKIMAWKLIAEPGKLPPNVAGNVAVAILKGDTVGAFNSAKKARAGMREDQMSQHLARDSDEGGAMDDLLGDTK